MRPPERSARTPASTANSICGNTAATAVGTVWSCWLISLSIADRGSASRSIESGLRSSVGTSVTCTFTCPRRDCLMGLFECLPRLLPAMLGERDEKAVGDIELGDAADGRAGAEQH